MSTTMLLATATTMAMATWWLRRKPAVNAPLSTRSSKPAAVKAKGPTGPLVVTSPGEAMRSGAQLWTLLPCSADCEATRLLGGRRLTNQQLVALPLLSSQGCRCRYLAMRNERGNERRSGNSRRDSYRLDSRGERRHADRRRDDALWAGQPAR